MTAVVSARRGVTAAGSSTWVTRHVRQRAGTVAVSAWCGVVFSPSLT
jgi:hypothetical protein